jgi:ABC-type phosphate/phosphonate transport system substrate-binding protein
MTTPTLRLGAVAYDPKVVTIWEGFKDWLAARGLAFDWVLFSTYEEQVAAHFAGQVDVAWNSPLAWVESVRLAAERGRRATAIAMRDTDRDLTSVVLVRADSPLREPAELRGTQIAVGASDSPQATLIPLAHLVTVGGLDPERDLEVVRHEVLVGKHGDHIGGERDAARALAAGTVDAACVIDGAQVMFTRDGTLAPGAVRVLVQTPPYDHCNLTVLDGAPDQAVGRFRELLLGMSYDDPEVRPLLDLEGLKAWKDGRTNGYAQLEAAVDRFRYLDPWLAAMRG